MDLFGFWKVPDRPRDSFDSLIVLSYAVKCDLTPTAPTRSIIDLAISRFENNPKVKIIMSTGDNQKLGVTNARVMKEYALSLGVPEKNLIEEGKSWDTLSNILESLKIMKEKSLKRPFFVLYDLHARRAAATAQTLGIRDFYYVSAGGPGEPACGWKYFQTYSRLTIFLYEFGASLYYLLAGKITLSGLLSGK